LVAAAVAICCGCCWNRGTEQLSGCPSEAPEELGAKVNKFTPSHLKISNRPPKMIIQ